MEKWDCCVQGQRHSKISKCQSMFAQMIFSESLNLLLPNLVWWCIIISQIVFQTDWFAIFKVKVTVEDNIIKIWLFDVLSELLIRLQLNFFLMLHHHKVDCPVKRLDCSVVVQLKVTGKVQNFIECSFGLYLLSCWTFCNQTWYGDGSSWARVLYKEIGLLSSRSRSHWGLM